MDVFYAFPSVLLAIALSGAMGAGVENTLLALTLVFIPPICRVSESVTTQVRGFDFVEAARASRRRHAHHRARTTCWATCWGRSWSTPPRLISVVDHPAPPACRFLGLGVKPPEPEWGLMLNTLRQAIYVQPGAGGAAGRDDLHHLDLLQPDERRPARGHGREGLTWTACARRRRSRRRRPSRCCCVDDLRKHFPDPRRPARPRSPAVRAVDDVSFSVAQGRDARHRRRIRLRQVDHRAAADAADRAATRAAWCFDGDPVGEPHGITVQRAAPPDADGVPGQLRLAQPAPARSPRRIAFAPKVHGVPASRGRARARATCWRKVGLDPDSFADRYPHELSGGQRQRVNIARALALRAAPGDPRRGGLGARQVGRGAGAEPAGRPQGSSSTSPTSSSATTSTSCSIISDRVLVMYLGQVVEIGPVEAIYARPQHPYTRALLRLAADDGPATSAPTEAPITGDPPNPINPPSGCRFRTRCPFAEDGLRRTAPSRCWPTPAVRRRSACHMRSRAAPAMRQGRRHDA